MNKLIASFSDKELKEVANAISLQIVTRGDEKTQRTSEMERMIIQNIAYGSLTAVRFGSDHPNRIQGIFDAAEDIFNQFFPGYKGYESIYIPLDRLIIHNRENDSIEVSEQYLGYLKERRVS